MRKSVLVVAAVVIGMGLAGRAVAQDKPPHEGAPMLRAGELAKALNLTDEQKQQVETILRKARADAEAASDPQARQQVRRSAFQQIEKVLTDEQRAKFTQFRQEQGLGLPGHPLLNALRQLNLTDAQKAQVEQIVRQMRADVEKAADLPAKQQIRETAMRKIRLEVLTDAQREQLKQIQQARGNHPQGERPAGQEHKHPAKVGAASRPA